MDCQNCMKYFNCPLVRSMWTKGRIWCYVPDSGTEEEILSQVKLTLTKEILNQIDENNGECLGFDDNYWENTKEI